jgi:hypothetical protein
MWVCERISTNSGWEPVAVFCVYGNEHTCFMKDGYFLYQLNEY